MKLSTRDQDNEMGKVDIAISFGLFIASALILFYGSHALSRSLSEPTLPIPLAMGQNYLSLEDSSGNTIGRLTVSAADTQQIELYGHGEIALKDQDAHLEFSAKINLLHQLQNAALYVEAGGTQAEYQLNGIYPLHAQTSIRQGDNEQTASTTYSPVLECKSFQDGNFKRSQFACKPHEVLARMAAVSAELGINIVPTDQFVAVPLYPSSVTFKELQRALLSAHLPLEDYDPIR